MKSKLFTLLKYELLSTSTSNRAKHGNAQIKKTARGGMIGAVILGIFLIILSFYMTLSVCITGGDDGSKLAPVVTILLITALNFFFTLLKTSGYMFAYKEYDMLMSLPFSVKTIATAKFMYMYIMNLGMTMAIAIPAIVATVMFGQISVLGIVIWVIIALFSPMIPMIVATAIGSFITSAGGKFKYKKIVQIALSMIFIVICFGARFFFQWLFQTYGSEQIFDKVDSFLDSFSTYYIPAGWAAKAVDGNWLYFILFIGVSLILFEAYFLIISKFYRQINSRLKTRAFHKEFKMSTQKAKSTIKTLTYNEFARIKNSTNYLINNGFGTILMLILSIVLIFVNVEGALNLVAPGSGLQPEAVLPAIPFIILFFVGMVPTTVVSYSLEGKNIWILKSLPITGMDVCRAKMRFNLFFNAPVAILSSLILGIRFGGSVLDVILFVIEGAVLVLYSTTFGMSVGLSHQYLDWDNEIEVLKRAPGILIYMLPEMLIAMVGGGATIAANRMGASVWIISIAGIIIFGILALLFYNGVKRKAKKLF